jgi:hypothetical protein
MVLSGHASRKTASGGNLRPLETFRRALGKMSTGRWLGLRRWGRRKLLDQERRTPIVPS